MFAFGSVRWIGGLVPMLFIGLFCLASSPTHPASEGEGKYKIKTPPPTFKCRIENETGVDVLVRVVSYYNTFSKSLKAGEKYTLRPSEYFQEGEKVACAFDDFDETVVCREKVVVKGKTRIILKKGDVSTVTWEEK